MSNTRHETWNKEWKRFYIFIFSFYVQYQIDLRLQMLQKVCGAGFFFLLPLCIEFQQQLAHINGFRVSIDYAYVENKNVCYVWSTDAVSLPASPSAMPHRHNHHTNVRLVNGGRWKSYFNHKQAHTTTHSRTIINSIDYWIWRRKEQLDQLLSQILVSIDICALKSPRQSLTPNIDRSNT